MFEYEVMKSLGLSACTMFSMGKAASSEWNELGKRVCGSAKLIFALLQVIAGAWRLMSYPCQLRKSVG